MLFVYRHFITNILQSFKRYRNRIGQLQKIRKENCLTTTVLVLLAIFKTGVR